MTAPQKEARAAAGNMQKPTTFWGHAQNRIPNDIAQSVVLEAIEGPWSRHE
ncbi:hypothetical protein C7401_13712 [Paraburkholderia unamae]|nr:hypothetical protein C7401_13712 [Paraburkholderia unamae]